MPLNPAIALAARPVEIADPMAMYGKIAAIQQAQNQNALAQRQMQEYDRSLQESEGIRNRLAGGAKIDDPETYNFLLGSKTGREILKQEVDLQKERTLQKKTEGELFDQRMKQIRELWGNVQTPEQAMAVHEATHLDPIVGKRLAAWNMTEQSGRQSILDAAKDPSSFAQFVKRAQLGAEKFMELNKPTTMQINRGGQTDLIQVPGMGGAPTTVSAYADVPLPANVEAQNSRIAKDGAARTIVKLPEQEKAFEIELGKGQANRILDSKIAAEDAAQILRTNQIGRDILASGAITGTGAEFFVGLNNALNQAGIDFGYADAAANSQAYAAALGGNVGKIIKQFGAGTGLSDADRKFAEQMAGGKITLSETALKRILDINDRVANNIIDLHNRNVKNIRTNVPLTVEKPIASSRHPSEAVSQIPGVKSTSSTGSKPASGGGLSAAEQAELDQLRKRFGR